MNGSSAQSAIMFLPLIAIVVLMYFITIRPQNKQRKETQEMRSSLTVGDDVVTIGGICGKVTKIKDDTIVLAVGADKNKMEFRKWAIKEITKPSDRKKVVIEEEDEEGKKKMPKRMDESIGTGDENLQQM